MQRMQEMWVWFLNVGRFSGEGNSDPLQYSCLGNPMDRGAWWATVHGVRVGHDWSTKQQLCSLLFTPLLLFNYMFLYHSPQTNFQCRKFTSSQHSLFPQSISALTFYKPSWHLCTKPGSLCSGHNETSKRTSLNYSCLSVRGTAFFIWQNGNRFHTRAKCMFCILLVPYIPTSSILKTCS